MTFCHEICPIAQPKTRRERRGIYPSESSYVVIEVMKENIKVAALQNNEHPTVLEAMVPEGATSTCHLPERIEARKRKGGVEGATERCPHIPRLNRAWITVSGT